MLRRQLLGATGLMLIGIEPIFATPQSLAAAIKAKYGDRKIVTGKIKLDIPRIAENGFVVPVTIDVESPMTAQDFVQGIALFSEMNPLPEIVEFQLGPHNGRARVSTRIRLASTQHVIAIAEMNDSTLWSMAVAVEVSSSGCG